MRLAALIAALCILIAVPGWPGSVTKTASPDSMMEDLARLGQQTHAAREMVLKKMLLDRGIPYSVERFSSMNRIRPVGANVIATLGSGNKDLVVCAHYDAKDMRDGTISQGMIDNGASTIVLLHLAEALKGAHLKHRVRIVFTDMEELGLLGSKRYVLNHDSDTVMAINVDVISTGKLIIFGDPGNPPLKQAVEQSCADSGVKYVALANYPAGDDNSFRGASIPTVSMAVVDEDDVRSMLRGPNSDGPATKPKVLMYMHTDQDTPDRVSAEAMSAAYEVLLRIVRKLDREL